MIMLAPPTPIGLDLGRRHMRAVQMAHGRVIAASTVLRRAPQQPIDADELTRLADVLYRQGFLGRRVVLAAPREAQFATVLQLPPRTPDVPIAQIARSEVARAQDCDPGTFEMAAWDIPAPARAGKGTHMLAAGCKHADTQPLLNACDAAGLDVVAIDIAAVALARATSHGAGDDAGMTALLDLDWTAGLLALRCGDAIIYERTVADIGLWHLHAQIEQQLNCDLDVAGYLLDAAARGSAGDDADAAYVGKASRIIDRFVQLIVDEVRASLDFAVHQYPDRPVRTLLLTGEGAALPMLCDRLHDATHVEARRVAPADIARCDDAVLSRCADAQLTLAAGLAQWRAA